MTICCFTCQVNADELFVGNERDNTVTVLDGERLNIIKTIFVGERPRAIVITPDHHREVLVCNGDNDDITIIDTSTLAVARTLQTGPDPETLALSPSGDVIDVSNENDSMVTVIEKATGKVRSCRH